ncbi:MAG: hypothetical protein J6R10_05525 [Tidjanibacter sp.]|nr:hypothetical protein [Tidjanibacter sp.]
MKRIIRYIALVSIATFGVSCQQVMDDLDSMAPYRESFIDQYWQITDTVDNSELVLFYGELQLRISVNKELIADVDGSTQELVDNHKLLSQQFGDTSYNRRTTPGIDSAIANSFMSIEITSDAAFDENHPAGSSLSDIVCWRWASWLPYIQSGYNDDWFVYGAPTKKPLRELAVADLTLLQDSDFFTFIFPNTPTLATQHNFTITMTTVEGEEYEYIVPVDFNTPKQ